MNERAAILALFLGFVACSEATQTVKPQKTAKPDDDDDDDDVIDRNSSSSSSSSSSGGSVIDAATGGAAVTYRGTLDQTPSFQFGGAAGHCTYNIIMSAIEIELAITPEGTVIGGTAKNNMTESLVGTCAYAPLGTKPMSFSFASRTGDTLTFAAGTTGAPKSDLTINLTKSGASYTGAVKWVRADRTDDLRWTATGLVTIGPK
jgi:hypothetical protein